jgi:hypothetical protein
MSSNTNESRTVKNSNKISKFIQEFSCSIITGITKVSIIQPFDFIRYRIQSSRDHHINTSNFIAKLINKEGFRVLLKGLDITTLAVLLSSIVQFTLYQELLHYITKSTLNSYAGEFEIFNLIEIERKHEEKLLNKIDDDLLKSNTIKKFSFLCSFAGFFTGMGMGLILTPIDNIRIKLQSVQNISLSTKMNYRFNNSLDCIKYTFNTSGILGFYIALPISVLRESFACTLYFGTFEYLKNREKIKYNKKKIKLYNSFIYGAICGGLNWIVTLPIDTIKTKLIADTIIPNNKNYTGVYDCFSKIYATSGLIGFYKGFSVVFTRALIVNGVVLTCFDLCRSKLVENNPK